jgi:hypothetical protein
VVGTNPVVIASRARPLAVLIGLLAIATAGVARAQSNPDFDAIAWTPLGCGASPLTTMEPRGEVNLVGDASFPAAYVAIDGTYVYFRYRVDDDPRASRRGFLSSSDWAMLVQVPSGNAFQYQYQFALNGDGASNADTVELWRNDAPEDLTFNPLFTDIPETKIFSQVFDAPGVNTTPLARAVPTGDGSLFSGNGDWFVEVAFPLAGLPISASDLGSALFFPVTATSPNRHNKDTLACPFVPVSSLGVAASVAPSSVSANATTRVTYTIALQASDAKARGVRVVGPALPSFLKLVDVSVDAPGATVAGQSPLDVRIPTIAAGTTVRVTIRADALFGCSDPGTSATFTAAGTNALVASSTATLAVVAATAPEVCDGVDNDCNGQIDEGGDALCDDHDVCTGIERCGGNAGCQPGTPPTCNDNNACTADSCDSASGCVHTPLPGCTGCQSPADCNDGEACTNDVCDAGVCRNVAIPDCTPCAAPSDCDDSDPCTADSCSAGVCEHVTTPGCVRCTSVGQCDDQQACTTDTCDAGICHNTPIPGCGVCHPTAESCTNGVDDDCDGLVDCADPDCATDRACLPPPVPEICGNCIDDDGDGLVDFEDPDCCSDPMALSVANLSLQTAPKGQGDRFRLDARYAAFTPPLFDPLRQDTSLVISEPGKPLFCTTITAQHWRRKQRLSFRFADPSGGFAGGLQKGQFRINRDGNVVFSARSRALGMKPVDGGSVRLTVRVGRQCSQSTLALRPARKGLVFP